MQGSGTCYDEIDNDGDTLVDCQDPEYFNVPPCAVPAPAVQSAGLFALSIALLIIGGLGLLGLRRAR